MYIAMNQFRVNPERATDFEKMWEERDSYLNEVPGFKSFHLLKGALEEDVQIYISHSLWENEETFTGWTQSDAFRKAHAQGGSPSGTLMGPPKFSGWQVVLEK